jgi:hypothetical protein
MATSCRSTFLEKQSVRRTSREFQQRFVRFAAFDRVGGGLREVGCAEDDPLLDEVHAARHGKLLSDAGTPPALLEALHHLRHVDAVAEVSDDRLHVEVAAVGRDLRHDHEARAGVGHDRIRALALRLPRCHAITNRDTRQIDAHVQRSPTTERSSCSGST